MMMNRYPTLRELAQAYFHQDYDLEADTPLEVVALFRRAVGPEKAGELRDEIASLLFTVADDGDVAQVWLEQAGAFYDPRLDGVTPREWLRQVAAELGAG
ncbi:contact-dependent growth inhibition system immunity protein [Streptomyces althioticus]|uniref:contact-dependent growth inhibition system immunity protein n=1 Tax=Streptomyces TaxID=1883 RepID=UPI0033D8AF0B